jgi:hypothetical protein
LRPTAGARETPRMRALAVVVTSLLALVLLGLWLLEAVVRGGTCGPSEGGGSCAAGVLSWALLGGAVSATAATIALTVSLLRRR